MSAPVPDDDLVSGAVRYLLEHDELVALVGSGGGWPFITQDEAPDDDLTGSAAIVVSYAGGVGAPNIHNTVRNMRLQADVVVDPLPDSAGQAAEPAETRRRAFAIFDVLDRILHRPQGGEVYFGSVRVFDSVRLAEPAIYTIPASGGRMRMSVFYGVMT